MACIVVCVVCLGLAVVVKLVQVNYVTTAKKAYLHSLERLSVDPHNPDRQLETRFRGRDYANLASPEECVKTFHEGAMIFKKAYQHGLERLKHDPHNPDRRLETLTLGREYANLARSGEGVMIFDEVAIMNEINAACAGAGKQEPVRVVVQIPNEPRSNGGSVDKQQ